MILQHNYTKPLPIETESQNLIFADPPYNIGVQYHNCKDNRQDYVHWAAKVMRDLVPLLKPGGTIWWLCPSDHFYIQLLLLKCPKLVSLYTIIKEETFSQYQEKTLTNDFRFLFCFQKFGPLTFNPDEIRVPSERQILNDKRANPKGRVPGRVWKFRRLQGTSLERVDWHPCQLPFELLTRIVKGWTNKGDNVLDAFAGSGNMGVVCKEFKRNFIGVDQSEFYCQKMRERLGE